VSSNVGIDVNIDVGVCMAADYEMLTYKEIADRLGIKLPSVRQTVSRRKWRRIKQNDGTIKIEVPVSYLQRENVVVDDAIDINVDVNVDVDNARLVAENEYLKKRIVDLENDRDRWHEIANKSWFKRLF